MDGSLRGEIRLLSAEGHSRRILPAVAFLLDSAGLTPRDVDGFGVTLGPGSFTGVRVGISTVQGMALASGRPCAGFSTLDVLAARIAGAADCLAPMLDAYRDQIFGAVYDRGAQLVSDRVVESPDAFAARLPEAPALIGAGAARHRRRLTELRPRALFSPRSTFLAAELARLAQARLEAGGGVDAESLRPMYLRQADIRRAPA